MATVSHLTHDLSTMHVCYTLIESPSSPVLPASCLGRGRGAHLQLCNGSLQWWRDGLQRDDFLGLFFAPGKSCNLLPFPNRRLSNCVAITKQ